jgi:hypothetical protein
MRHSDVRVTTGTYGHLLVEDLRAAVDAHSPLSFGHGQELDQPRARAVAGNPAPSEPHEGQRPGTARADAGKNHSEIPVFELERETGFEPATLSLGS